jgi:hypothetical protein
MDVLLLMAQLVGLNSFIFPKKFSNELIKRNSDVVEWGIGHQSAGVVIG